MLGPLVELSWCVPGRTLVGGLLQCLVHLCNPWWTPVQWTPGVDCWCRFLLDPWWTPGSPLADPWWTPGGPQVDPWWTHSG